MSGSISNPHHTSRCITAFGILLSSKNSLSASGSGACLAQFLGVDARGDEQAIQAAGGRARQVGADGVADREHAVRVDRPVAQLRLLQRQIVDRRCGLPA